MSRFELILLCLCLGACTGSTVDPLALAGLRGSGYALVETASQFRGAVVGHSLAGAGYRVTVAEGGTLNGLYLGEAFQGVWVFRDDGQYCQSFRDSFLDQSSACYWVAVKGDDIRLIPVPANL